MIEIFIYIFIYLSGVALFSEMFDLREHACETRRERILMVTSLLLWPATLVMVLTYVAISTLYQIMVK